MMSSRLEKILTDVLDMSQKQNAFHTTYDHALEDLVKNTNVFSLFETPIVEKQELGVRCADVLVGFIANTEASFVFCTGSKDHPVRIPFTLKKGEFIPAWKGESIFPISCVAYHPTWIEQLQGSVRGIYAILTHNDRKELLLSSSYSLDTDYAIIGGSLCKKDLTC